MKKLPIALQLWSLRERQAKDFAATVEAVAKIGYAGVELAGYGNLDAKGVKAALDQAGLKVAGMHVGIDALRANLNAVINDALLFGTRHVVCPSWPVAQFPTAAPSHKFGELLAAAGATLRAHGLQFGYHNHAGELKLVEGRTVFEWMLGAAAPRDLAAEVDVYWVQKGGQDPAKVLRAFGARSPLVHLKDEKELGLGPVDFKAVFAAIDDVAAAEWLIVEQDAYNHEPLESVRLCFEQLKGWGRA
jgi:sugar phosphate isomerase/epimerase